MGRIRDLIEELKLEEMSLSKDMILSKLSDHVEDIIIHLLCLIFYNDNRERWKSEVYAFLNRTYKWKKNNKFLDEKVIRSQLLYWQDVFADQFDNWIDELTIKESRPVQNKVTKEEVEDILVKYFTWISARLSEVGKVTKEEVSRKIDDLIKYP